MSGPTYTWTPEEMITHAQRAIGRVTLHGYRGATLVTAEETVALIYCLTLLGMPPLSKEQSDAVLKPPHKPVDGDNAL